jgi:hypothetical protein
MPAQHQQGGVVATGHGRQHFLLIALEHLVIHTSEDTRREYRYVTWGAQIAGAVHQW